MRCTVEEVARGEEAYFAAHGRYFGGACRDVPGVRLTDTVVCVLTATANGFAVLAIAPLTTFTKGCRWRSRPPEGESSLSCS